MTEVFKVHPQCMWQGLTVMQLGLFPNRKQIKSWTFRMWEPNWERGCSAWCWMKSPSILVMAGDGSSSCPFPPPYRSRRVVHLRFSCQVDGGGGVLNGELVGDRAMSHVPSHWNYLLDLLQHFNYCADLPRCGIASCRSSPTIRSWRKVPR